MYRAIFVSFALFGLFLVVSATNVQQCKNFKFDLDGKVNISSCTNAPCRLRRKTTAYVQMRFTPEIDVKNLRTSVNAEIAGIPFPFIGVDGTSACGKLFTSDGLKKVDCPLKKGVELLYKNEFNVLPQYPKIKVLVHWALTDAATRKPMTCFEVPARITN